MHIKAHVYASLHHGLGANRKDALDTGLPTLRTSPKHVVHKVVFVLCSYCACMSQALAPSPECPRAYELSVWDKQALRSPGPTPSTLPCRRGCRQTKHNGQWKKKATMDREKMVCLKPGDILGTMPCHPRTKRATRL